MGFFDHLQKGGAFSLQGQKPQVRKVVQTRPAPTPRLPSASKSTAHPSENKSILRISSARNIKRASSSECPERNSLKKRPGIFLRGRKKPTPEQLLSSEDDDESDPDTSFQVRKRVRTSESTEPDYSRQIRSIEAFSENLSTPFTIIHAADVASCDKQGKYIRAFNGPDESAELFLQYPSASQKEKYHLVFPREPDEFKPIAEIVHVIDTVADHYVFEEEAHIFNDESQGIRRKVRRAVTHTSEAEFRETIELYNCTIDRLRRDGSIAKKLDANHRLELSLVERILTQIYSRTVSPRVESLRRYENGTDNVYGELLPRFISTIFKETKLKSDQLFVDLGSGVGNVVLQAALEIGCESWGCEVMQNVCDLAQLQQTEFMARCRLWGILPGNTHLVRGDFLKEEKIVDVLKRADVVLINNQAFTPQLNTELINLFLDMKEGCQIVSLKSFVPAGNRIQSRNLNSPVNVLTVKQKNYWSNSVSWTDAGGTYFIATKDSSRLKAFVQNLG